MPRIVLERSLKGKEKSLLDAAFPEGRLAVVFDPQTYEALGQRVIEAMPEKRAVEILLPSHPSPTVSLVDAIRAQSKECTALVAIGSGTINDLCKRAAFLEGKPYAVFATAPSMNGYVSANASLYAQGLTQKETFSAAAPVYVFTDLEVLASAPLRLIRSGLGDSLCRATAQVDWLMSHLLLHTPYDVRPFDMLMGIEEALFTRSAALAQGDVGAVELLMRTLLLSGEGMTLAGGSYPASQGEHMIAHCYESLDHQRAQQEGTESCKIFHGEIIAVTTLEMAALQARLLAEPSLRFERLLDCDNEIMRSVFEASAEAYPSGFAVKQARIASQLSHMATRWQEARRQVAAVTHAPEFLKDVMEAAGAATTPAALGLREDLYHTARQVAFYTRERFTFLDLEAMTASSS